MSLTKAMTILGFNSKRYILPKEMSTIEKYDFLCDYPMPMIYKSLDEKYDLKFIYTDRNNDSWLNSVRAHYLRNTVEKSTEEGLDYRKEAWGIIDFDEEIFIQKREEYHNQAIEYFKDRPEDILFLNISEGEGWESLCSFLNVDVPNVDFPHENKSCDKRN